MTSAPPAAPLPPQMARASTARHRLGPGWADWCSGGRGFLAYPDCSPGRSPLEAAPVLPSVLTALGVGLLAAVAIDAGFGPGFVDDAIAYPAVIYSAWVAGAIARLRAQAGGGARALALNLMSHASVSAIVLVLLRTVARVELPIGSFSTTGHYPYFAVPVACTVAQLVWELMGKRRTNRAPEVNV